MQKILMTRNRFTSPDCRIEWTQLRRRFDACPLPFEFCRSGRATMVTRVSWRDRSFSCGGGGPQLPRRIVVRVVAIKFGTDRLYKCRLIAVQLQHLIYFRRDDRLCRSLLTGLRGDSLPSPETCGKPPSPHDGRALDPKLTPNSQLRHAIALPIYS